MFRHRKDPSPRTTGICVRASKRILGFPGKKKLPARACLHPRRWCAADHLRVTALHSSHSPAREPIGRLVALGLCCSHAARVPAGNHPLTAHASEADGEGGVTRMQWPVLATRECTDAQGGCRFPRGQAGQTVRLSSLHVPRPPRGCEVDTTVTRGVAMNPRTWRSTRPQPRTLPEMRAKSMALVRLALKEAVSEFEEPTRKAR